MSSAFSDLYRQWPIYSIAASEAKFLGDPFGRTYNTYYFDIKELIKKGYQPKKGLSVWFHKGPPGVDFLSIVSEEEAVKARKEVEENGESTPVI